MKAKVFLSSCLLVFSTLFTGCITIIEPGEAGLVWRPFGTGLGKTPLGAQVQFYWPWNSIFVYPVQWKSYTEQVDVLTRDDLTINVRANVILRAKENELYDLQMKIGVDFYEKVVRPQFRTAIRNVLSAYNMVSISKETPNVSGQIKKQLQEKLLEKHVEIDDVIIDDIAYSQSILRAIENKLTKQQEQEQMKFEINIAKKDAEISVISAEGKAKAILIEAEAQAKAQKLQADSISAKYIQLKAMENANTKLIVIPQGKEGLPLLLNSDQKWEIHSFVFRL